MSIDFMQCEFIYIVVSTIPGFSVVLFYLFKLYIYVGTTL